MKVTHYNLDGTSNVVEVEDYTPTAEELQAEKQAEIEAIKVQLAESDYKALKFAEGWMTSDEYAPIKAMRQSLRDRINELESEISNETK